MRRLHVPIVPRRAEGSDGDRSAEVDRVAARNEVLCGSSSVLDFLSGESRVLTNRSRHSAWTIFWHSGSASLSLTQVAMVWMGAWPEYDVHCCLT